MGGLFGGGGRSSAKSTKTAAQLTAEQDAASARARADERAESSEIFERQGIAKRRRLRRTGGMRLLLSPERMEGPNAPPTSTNLGGGS
tara:strand:- start:494 stop:757 length:264 start_codon:yes stop_codon:yes gene_type:complete